MNEKPVIPVRNKPNVSPNNPSLPAVSTADHNYTGRCVSEYKSLKRRGQISKHDVCLFYSPSQAIVLY